MKVAIVLTALLSLSACSGEGSEAAPTPATVTTTETAAAAPSGDTDAACSVWRREVDADTSPDRTMAAADRIMAAAEEAFEPGTAPYRLFTMQAGALMYAALKDEQDGGLNAMQEWLTAREIVREAAEGVDRVC